MATETLQKLSPQLMYLRGFDRRGASASLSAATISGLTLSGNFADQADFAVLLLHEENDLYGYMAPNGTGATKYLPNHNLSGLVLETDVAITNAFSPLSVKFDSLNAAQLAYVTSAGLAGYAQLAQFITSTTGGAPAKVTITVDGSIVAGDKFYIVYLGNYQTFYQAVAGDTPATVASALTLAMNANAPSGLSIVPFAVWNSPESLMIYAGRSAVATQMTLSGTSMTIRAAYRSTVGFWGLRIGDPVVLNCAGVTQNRTVAAFIDPWHVTLDSAVTLTAPPVFVTYSARGTGVVHDITIGAIEYGISGLSNHSGLVQVETFGPNGFTTGQTVRTFGLGPSFPPSGLHVVTVIDATHFTIDGSIWPGSADGTDWMGAGVFTIGATYTYTEASGDSSSAVAAGIAAAVNSGAGDPNAVATPLTEGVSLAPKNNDGTGVICSTTEPSGSGSGTISISGNTVVFGFFNYLGAGYSHTITIGATTYTHVQVSTDGSGDIAIALAAAINAKAGDTNAVAAVSANNVTLSPRIAQSTVCSASDGNGPGTLTQAVNGFRFDVSNSFGTGFTHYVKIGTVTYNYVQQTGDTADMIASALTTAINAGVGDPLASASVSSATVTLTPKTTDTTSVSNSDGARPQNSVILIELTTAAQAMWPLYHADGNSVQLWVATNSAAGRMVPDRYPKLTGGASETAFHAKIDFTAAGIDQLRQAWFTVGPVLNYGDQTPFNQSPALMPYVGSEYSLVFSNWAVADPGGIRNLKVAGLGTVTVGSRDTWATYSGSWVEVPGFYEAGFIHVSTTLGSFVDVKYSCQAVHDLYLGTQLGPGGGVFSVRLDGVAQPDIDTALNVAPPITARKLIAAGVAAGSHVVRFTVKVNATNCYFDFVQAAVKSDVIDPPAVYPGVNLARDSDTGWTGFVTPFRNLDISERAGFHGDIDFFAGSLFPLKRARSGGSFRQATISLGGVVQSGNSFFLSISGISVGVGVVSLDTFDTLASRAVNAINTLFVGVYAAPTATDGQFTITLLSPINGFTLTATPGLQLTITVTGDISAGNEGVWQADPTQVSPLNRALADYLADFCALAAAKGRTVTVALSDEILGPPDLNTSAGGWSQRYANGGTVMTSTGFGSWGAGFVESVAAGVYKQTGHGYVSGNIAHLASAGGSGSWIITVTDADHYQLTTPVSNTGGYTPAATDSVFIELQTTQCAFNPATVTAYLAACYKQAAAIMAIAGLTPWLQFGEVGWWFFSRLMSQPIGFASFTSPISIGTPAPHNFATGQKVIVAGVQGTTAANGTWPIIVTDPTHFTLTGSAGNGAYVAGTGTVSGGGMAYYDAYTSAAAATALGRALTAFYTQDDDPTINGGADANFLAGLLKTHIDAIRSAVLATQGGSKFELLWPADVNFPACYYTNDLPYPQGGRLNRRVNLPAPYLTKAGSGIDRLKIEALSWGATYRSLGNAIAAMTFPMSVGSWAVADVAYLIPWFNGGCPWQAELLASGNLGISARNLWAGDHFVLLSPTLPLPSNPRAATVF